MKLKYFSFCFLVLFLGDVNSEENTTNGYSGTLTLPANRGGFISLTNILVVVSRLCREYPLLYQMNKVKFCGLLALIVY